MVEERKTCRMYVGGRSMFDGTGDGRPWRPGWKVPRRGGEVFDFRQNKNQALLWDALIRPRKKSEN
jgi:hypothetical protein